MVFLWRAGRNEADQGQRRKGNLHDGVGGVVMAASMLSRNPNWLEFIGIKRKGTSQ